MKDEGHSERLEQARKALTGLVKLIKAAGYYPPGHPALGRAAAQAVEAFASLLRGREKALLTVRKEGFFIQERPVSGQDGALGELALLFFARRIHSLLALPDLSGDDLEIFTRALIREPDEIRGMGGLQTMLEKAGVSTIWINEIDLSEILLRKEAIEARPEERMTGGEEVPHDRVREEVKTLDLRSILRELQGEVSHERYSFLLREMVPQVRRNLTEGGRPLVLSALSLLCRDFCHSETRRQNCREALAQLTRDDLLDYLMACLCTRGLKEGTREGILRILAFLGRKATEPLMERLGVETDSLARKRLRTALVRQGPKALPTLIRYLGDERWYVVRNAAAILGEIRHRDAVPHLTPVLAHREIRVRRETIRALSKIGDPSALDTLLRIVEEAGELGQEALLCLGALKAPAAVPTLLKLVKKTDPLGRITEVKKGAVMALGEIGATEAVPHLTAILGRRRLWRRRGHDTIRAACARALGKIGDRAAAPALETATGDRSAAVALAASRALEAMARRSQG